MRIAVCVKQIPDPATPYELAEDTHRVVRPNDQVLDDTDRFGVEVGLQLAEGNDGSVTPLLDVPFRVAPGNPPGVGDGSRQGGHHRR